MSFGYPHEWAPLDRQAIQAWAGRFRSPRQPIREAVPKVVRDGAKVMLTGSTCECGSSSSAQVNVSITPASPTVQISGCKYDRHPDCQYFIQRCAKAPAKSELHSLGRRAAGESSVRPMSTLEQSHR